jgi:hypothetical protein
MALIFGWPLVQMPSYPSPSTIDWGALDSVAIAESPFSGRQQIQNWKGSRMEASVQMPPMPHALAQDWIAWLLACQGATGVFEFGDPLGRNPRGTGAGTLTVNGSGQGGYAMSVTGGSGANVLLPGDWIQIGFRLYRNLGTYNGGAAALSIWPQIRESPLHGAAIVTSNTKGLFRLKTNQRRWSVTEARHYGIQFDIREAI